MGDVVLPSRLQMSTLPEILNYKFIGNDNNGQPKNLFANFGTLLSKITFAIIYHIKFCFYRYSYITIVVVFKQTAMV